MSAFAASATPLMTAANAPLVRANATRARTRAAAPASNKSSATRNGGISRVSVSRPRRDVRVDVFDPLSIVVGGAAVVAGRSLMEGGADGANGASDRVARLPVVAANVDRRVDASSSSSSSSSEASQIARADLAPIAHSFDGVFASANAGALVGMNASPVPGGWWNGTIVNSSAVDGAGDAPRFELQAITDDARRALTDVVLGALKSACASYAPERGFEAEAAQELLAAVAETSTREWLEKMTAATAEEGGIAGEVDVADAETEDGAMVTRAGDLAAELIQFREVESPGSKTALYVNLLSHVAALSKEEPDPAAEPAETPSTARRATTPKVRDGEMAEAAIELASVAKARADDAASRSMAAITVSVLEDVTLRISEAVTSAYLSRVRESASAPAVQRSELARGVDRREKKRSAELARKTAALAAASASRVVRYALALTPRLKATRALEKFRNEVKLQAWVDRNYTDVVAMYEDWHDLVGVDANGNIVRRRISICRHSELDRVKGLRLIVSVFLELADVIVPVSRAFLSRAQQFTSWLLVTLIGRSLGLVYRGIKESMGGGGNNADNKPRFA